MALGHEQWHQDMNSGILLFPPFQTALCALAVQHFCKSLFPFLEALWLQLLNELAHPLWGEQSWDRRDVLHLLNDVQSNLCLLTLFLLLFFLNLALKLPFSSWKH